MLIHRPYILDAPLLAILHRFCVSYLLDFSFFLILNNLYILASLALFIFKKDAKFYLRRAFFLITNLPIFILFFMDMQTLAVQDQLFSSALFSAFKLEYLLNIGIFIKDYLLLSFIILAALIAVFLIAFLNVEYDFKRKNYFDWKKLSAVFMLSWLGILLYTFIIFNSINYLPYYDDRKYNGSFKRLYSYFQKNRGCASFIFSRQKSLNILSQFRNSHIYRSDAPRLTETNVIIFVIESLSGGYINKEYTPFINSLSDKGLFLKNHFSTVKGTNWSMHAILTGSSFLLSLRKINYLQFLKQSGYETSFFFGDKRSFFLSSVFTEDQSMQKYWTREDYEKEIGVKSHRDKEGNIFELPFLKFSAGKIKQQKAPFFSIILTNQPHYPYYCVDDKQLENMSPDERSRYCLRYIDRALQAFFEEIKDSPFFEKTLFVITGDHVGLKEKSGFDRKNHYYNFNVPLLFYHPEEDLSRFESEELSSHIDIMPSLIDYLQLPYEYSFVHNSIFKNKRRFIIDQIVNAPSSVLSGFSPLVTRLMDKDHILHCRNNGFHLYKNDRGKEGPAIVDEDLKSKYENLLKSILTYYSF